MSMQHTPLKRVRVSERLDAWEVRGESEGGYAIEITDVSKRQVPDPYARAWLLPSNGAGRLAWTTTWLSVLTDADPLSSWCKLWCLRPGP